MKTVAWGYVTRDNGNGMEVLVAERYKGEDILRSGQLVLPGGGLEIGEWYFQAAIREVREETGIETELGDTRKFNNIYPRHFNNANISVVSVGKRITITYRDNGKSYFGEIYDLKPIDLTQEPITQEDSDTRNPKYLLLSEMFERKEEFTPACHVLVDIIKEAES